MDDNFRTNMRRARDRLEAHLKNNSWDEAGLTRAQVEAASCREPSAGRRVART